MNTPPKDADGKRDTTRSSVAVSTATVCEDDACIGKTVPDPAVPPEESAQPGDSNAKRSKTSMSIGGKNVCSDEACIGKS